MPSIDDYSNKKQTNPPKQLNTILFIFNATHASSHQTYTTLTPAFLPTDIKLKGNQSSKLQAQVPQLSTPFLRIKYRTA
jgi:hypothetical protein